jgi:hypothetical protein
MGEPICLGAASAGTALVMDSTEHSCRAGFDPRTLATRSENDGHAAARLLLLLLASISSNPTSSTNISSNSNSNSNSMKTASSEQTPSNCNARLSVRLPRGGVPH